MILLTIKCERCSKEVSHDMSNERLSQDAIRKFGFVFTHDGKNNILICLDCEKSYIDLKDRLEQHLKLELCGFFKNCGEEEKNGNKRECKNV